MYHFPLQITLDIPEAFAVEGCRTRLIHKGQVRRMLGYETPMQVHALLKEHNVHLNYSIEDLEQERTTIARIFSDSPPPPRRVG